MQTPSSTPIPSAAPVLLAATETVRHRLTSTLVEGFSQWWQMPALLLGMALAAAFVIWAYRRDADELPWPLRILLALLRLGALAAVAAALLDFERITEHEIVFPSRVAVLVDSSASMTLADEPSLAGGVDAAATGPAASRAALALDALEAGGLLEALRETHEVSIWRFDADAERLAVLPAGQGRAVVPADAGTEGSEPGWREQLAPSGAETRLGDALTRALDDEPADVLAGVILLCDGGHNAGSDPTSAAAGLVGAGVAVHPLGIGSDTLPANLRIADVVVPARVFPGDRFSVTAYLQPQGLVGRTARVEIAESSADGAASDPAAVRPLDAVDAALGADGDLVPVRFDVPGLATPGRRAIVVRVVPPPEDRTPADDRQVVDIEVVERVTRVLLMAGGAGREFQFMRNVLERDKSFAVDVLLGTTAGAVAAGTRGVRAAFPDTDAVLADYDVVVAFDYDWRHVDPAARTRLERWVARESGGLMLVAGGISMDHWLGEPRMEAVRGLFPVDLRRPNQLGGDMPFGSEKPHPLKFTRDGADAEFLWLSSGRATSEALWGEFPGVYSCFDAGPPKPGATVYARVERPGPAAAESQPVYLAGQFYGSGTVLYAGSGEFWRLRALGDSIHERITTQLMRHVSQGRLLRGSRRGRLLVDRDRFPVGASVAVRLVLPEGTPGPGAVPTCRATGPEGRRIAVKLAAEPGRNDVLRGTFVASREGTWQIDVESVAGQADEPLSRRVQAHLPDRELAHPRLDRRLLEQLAATTGGSPHFPGGTGWDVARSRALAASIPDRSRRDYEPGVADLDFKQRLNTALLGAGAGLLCLEWIIRRLVRLA